ncbi:MAG: hypothetical protein ACLFTH_02385 [Candidatus Woesearchaeota archaeon]
MFENHSAVADVHSKVKDLSELLVSWVDENVKRTRWDDEKVERDFARRSVYEILADGTTFYMNPCPDFASVALYGLYYLSSEGVKNPQLIAVPEINGYGVPSVHFHDRFEYDDTPYIMDFVSHNKVIVTPEDAHFNPNSEVQTLGKYLLEGPHDFSKNLPQNYSQLKNLLQHFDLDAHVEKLKTDNTPQEFVDYQDRLGGKHNLYTVFSPFD